MAGAPVWLPTCPSRKARMGAARSTPRRVNRTRDALAAVDRAVFALTGVRGRKALLFLTEGFLNDSDLGPVQEVAGRCREANLVVYSLDVRGLMTGLAGADENAAPDTAEMAPDAGGADRPRGRGQRGPGRGHGRLRGAEHERPRGGRLAGGRRVADLLPARLRAARGQGPARLAQAQGRGQAAGPQGAGAQGLHAADERGDRGGRGRQARPQPKSDRRTRQGDEGNGSGAPQAVRLPTDMARALATAHDADAIPLRAMAYALRRPARGHGAHAPRGRGRHAQPRQPGRRGAPAHGP